MEEIKFIYDKSIQYFAMEFGIDEETADKIISGLDLTDEIVERYKDDTAQDWQEEVDRAVEQQYEFEREIDIHRGV